MSPLETLLRKIAHVTIGLTLLAAIGCGSAATPDKAPQDLEKLRTEMKATSARELSGSK